MFRRRRRPEAGGSLTTSLPLWGTIAALAYVSGSRRARRAALRGLIAAALSGPPAAMLGRARQEGPGPSRDAAIAASFGTAAVLELRSFGLPIAAVAGASMAASARLGPGSSPAGSLLGAAAAVGSTRIWPVAPSGGSDVATVWLPAEAEPSDDGAGLVIAVNSESGNGVAPTQQLRKALPRAEVVEVDVTDGGEVRSMLEERAVDAIALGVAGGDGTVNTAAQIALEEGKVLMAIPSGTFNHLTAALGMETVEDSVRAIKHGEAAGIDVGMVDGRVFLNAASFGGYVEFVDAREKLERRIGKWPAVIVALVRMLRGYEPLRIEIDGKEACVWMAFIGNCRYHPSGFAPSWRERLDDELLDFRYVDGSAPFARTRLTLAVLTGRLGRSKVYHQSVVKRLSIRSLNGPLRLAADGETFDGSDEVVIEKHPERLTVYVPHEDER